MKLKELKKWIDENYSDDNKDSPIYVGQWSENDTPLTGVSDETGYILLDIQM